MKTTITILSRNETTVTLVGTCHVGTKAYYNKIQEICDNSDVVLYEQIQAKDTKEKVRNLQTMQASLDVLNYKREIPLVFQQHNLTHRKDWINADISMETLKGLKGELGMQKLIPEAQTIPMPNSTRGKLIRAAYKVLPQLYQVLPGPREITINLRNSLCLIHLANILPVHKDIIILYGQGHMKLFIKQLREMGFVQINKETIKVVSLE